MREIIPLLMLAASLSLSGCGSASRSSAQLTDAQVMQLDRLFKVATQFQRELENVVAQARYPDDNEKANAGTLLHNHTVSYHLLRLKYLAVKKSKRHDDLADFFRAAFIDHIDFQRPVAINPAQFRKPLQPAPYADVSRLEALQDEFRVMTISLLSDIQ
jgi:hypothetical protein